MAPSLTTLSEEPLLPEAHKPLRGHYQVIEEADPKDGPGVTELARYGDVLCARIPGTRRVVMGTDNRGRPVSDGIGEDLARVDQALVQRPYSDCPAGDDLPCPVQGDDDKVLLLLVPEKREERFCIFRLLYLCTFGLQR